MFSIYNVLTFYMKNNYLKINHYPQKTSSSWKQEYCEILQDFKKNW